MIKKFVSTFNYYFKDVNFNFKKKLKEKRMRECKIETILKNNDQFWDNYFLIKKLKIIIENWYELKLLEE